MDTSRRSSRFGNRWKRRPSLEMTGWEPKRNRRIGRLLGTYLHADEDGVSVSLSPHRASLNTAWALEAGRLRELPATYLGSASRARPMAGTSSSPRSRTRNTSASSASTSSTASWTTSTPSGWASGCWTPPTMKSSYAIASTKKVAHRCRCTEPQQPQHALDRRDYSLETATAGPSSPSSGPAYDGPRIPLVVDLPSNINGMVIGVLNTGSAGHQVRLHFSFIFFSFIFTVYHSLSGLLLIMAVSAVWNLL